MRKGAILPLYLSLCSILFLAACQPGTEATESPNPVITEVEDQSEPASTIPESNADVVEIPAEPEALEEFPYQRFVQLEPDEGWKAGPHSATYVLDGNGNNATCARCHSPVEWLPGPESIPESCMTCKFDVDEPDPLISEAAWGHVDCKTCHRVDKDDVEPDYVWLDIAVIEEYIEVDSTTDLCRKCHQVEDIPDHKPGIQLSEDHVDLTCTECHDAHQTTVSCIDSDCHSDPALTAEPIAGHDEDHQLVSCIACHDAAGLAVGPLEGEGIWVTFTTVPARDGDVPHASHQIQTEVACDRCHFAGNPWNLSEDVQTES
jgi:hypothetical protein